MLVLPPPAMAKSCVASYCHPSSDKKIQLAPQLTKGKKQGGGCCAPEACDTGEDATPIIDAANDEEGQKLVAVSVDGINFQVRILVPYRAAAGE